MEYKYRDILKEPLSLDELEDLASLGSMQIRDLVNRRSTAFKKMGVNSEEMTSRQAGDLILKNPRIMYRPLFTHGASFVMGFKPEEMEEII